MTIRYIYGRDKRIYERSRDICISTLRLWYTIVGVNDSGRWGWSMWGGVLGVGGTLWWLSLRFQNLALGPLVMNDKVHRERPRNDSGRWTAAVSNDETESMVTILYSGSEKNNEWDWWRTIQLLSVIFQSLAIGPVGKLLKPLAGHKVPSPIFNPDAAFANQGAREHTSRGAIPEVMWDKRKTLSQD